MFKLSAGLIALLLIGAGSSLFLSHEGSEQVWEGAKQAWQLALERLVEPATDWALLEFEGRIDPMSLWEQEWASDNVDLSEYLRSRVRSSFPAELQIDTDLGPWTTAWRGTARLCIDMPSASLESPELSIRETDTEVRYLELDCELSVERKGWSIRRVARTTPGGAWLDDRVGHRLNRELADLGFEIAQTSSVAKVLD